jgi:TetR/AcrR family transcriptional repressor of nem operon
MSPPPRKSRACERRPGTCADLAEEPGDVERIVTDAIREGQKPGEIGKAKDAVALARFFVATVQGMRATGRHYSRPAPP